MAGTVFTVSNRSCASGGLSQNPPELPDHILGFGGYTGDRGVVCFCGAITYMTYVNKPLYERCMGRKISSRCITMKPMKKRIAGFLVTLVAAMPVLACCCTPVQENSSHQHSTSDHSGHGHASHEHGNLNVSSVQDHQDCDDECKQSLQTASFTAQDIQLPKIKTDFQPDLTAAVSARFAFFELYLSDRDRWGLYRADNPNRSSLPIFLSTRRLRI